jgi:hypothetical protein
MGCGGGLYSAYTVYTLVGQGEDGGGVFARKWMQNRLRLCVGRVRGASTHQTKD